MGKRNVLNKVKTFTVAPKLNYRIQKIIDNYYLTPAILSVINHFVTSTDISRRTGRLTQMIKTQRVIDPATSNRKLHMELVEAIVEEIANDPKMKRKCNYNISLLRFMAKFHDIGHEPFRS